METVILFSIVTLIAFLFLKYFAADSAPSDTESEFSWVERNIEQVLVMFPNIPAPQIAFDLSRTRNVEVTIEKLLNGTLLPNPPHGSRFASWNQVRQVEPMSQPDEPKREDLIQRYHLEQRKDESPTTQTYQWSKNRQEREQLLRKRKEDAVLAARRKLLQADLGTT